MRRILPVLLAAIALAACGSSPPANVAGTYSVAVTNRDNACNLQNWTVGNTASNIGVVITQNGSQAVATVQNPTGAYLDVVLGAHEFTGSVDGSHVSLTLFGTRTSNSGNCTWTYNGELDADLTGNALQGMIFYVAKTNGNPDCTAAQNTCKSQQDFSGTRPPV